MRYRLPRVIAQRLTEACRGLRNGEAVMRLAVFLARFHTAPGRLGRSFPVDRIALAAHAELDLSAAQIRGALAVLEDIGFVARLAAPGSPYRRTEAGLRRKPVQWQIGAAFAVVFETANRIARARREKAERRSALVAKKNASSRGLISGEQSPLEAALTRWGAAVSSGQTRSTG
jgi:hypothetical protein